MQDRQASESVVVTPRSGRGNLETRGHDASHLSFPIENEDAFSSLILELE